MHNDSRNPVLDIDDDMLEEILALPGALPIEEPLEFLSTTTKKRRARYTKLWNQ